MASPIKREAETAAKPRWINEDKVFRWVIEALEEADLEDEYEFAMLRWDTHPGIPSSNIEAHMEREAIEKAERSDFGPLADLLRPDHPANTHPFGKRPIREVLAPETWVMIADRLAGRWKRKPGRPPMTEDERRAMNPVHDARDEVSRVIRILTNAYPDQSAADIKDRAVAIVTRHRGLRSDLATHVNRSKKDHRRPMNHPKPKKTIHKKQS